MTIVLNIGGYALRVRADGDHAWLAWPLPPFEKFLRQSETPPDIDFAVCVVQHLPNAPHGRLIFDSCHGLWKLFSLESGYFLESCDPQSLKPRCRAVISRDYSQAEVWIREHRLHENSAWAPMHVINPVVEVCLLTRMAREGGLLLHASGILSEDGWVFSGPSGAGKSTLSDLFSASGACVLSDERVIIRKIGDGVRVFGTPWVGTSCHAHNGSGPLTRLFCIRHGSDRHTLETLPPRALSQFILQQCFLPYWDEAAMDGTLSALDGLIEHVDCDGLAFLNTPDVVDFLHAHRFARAASSP